jgi:DNA polymerase
VFGEGNPHADWLFIGEAPGQQEDLQGQPFVGPAGQLLTEMLRAMGLVREQIFITNVIKCRPPNNRDPHVDEMAHCRDYLQQQIARIQPKIIIAVGRVAAQALLNSSDSLGQLRGKVHRYQAIPLMVIYHPAYLLRSLLAKRTAWQDLQVILQQTRALGL